MSPLDRALIIEVLRLSVALLFHLLLVVSLALEVNHVNEEGSHAKQHERDKANDGTKGGYHLGLLIELEHGVFV